MSLARNDLSAVAQLEPLITQEQNFGLFDRGTTALDAIDELAIEDEDAFDLMHISPTVIYALLTNHLLGVAMGKCPLLDFSELRARYPTVDETLYNAELEFQ